jgi:nitrate reductase NapE component
MDDVVVNGDAPIAFLGVAGPWIVGALIVLMFLALIGVIWLTYKSKTEKKDGRVKKSKIRRGTIQFLSVGLGLPALVVLALVGALGAEALATLFGAFFGYVLSGISDEEKDSDSS